jgi:hypothetical protein
MTAATQFFVWLATLLSKQLVVKIVVVPYRGISWAPWVKIYKTLSKPQLVGGFNPSEKYESQLG